MDENPYVAPKAPISEPPPVVVAADGPELYAKIRLRMRAYFIDALLALMCFVVVSVLGARLHDIAPTAGPVLFVAWVLGILLYEPVMVALTGGTVGHHLKNIHVVSDKTGRRPGLAAALLRHLIKQTFGWISLLFMLSSERLQALHDSAVGVTVRIKDETRARRRDYVRGRKPITP
jgi:uncharacterized RDD family membrane protein YckC